jgi:hypothetical protein
MGSCIGKAEERTLAKDWSKSNDKIPIPLSPQSSLKEKEAMKRQIEKTAEQLFDKFNTNKNGVLDKH